MVGFWPHPRYAKYHRKETPCKEKSNQHGKFLFFNYEKKENFCLNKEDYYNLEEFDDYNKYNILSLDKKVYDAEKKMFFHPRYQEVKTMNRYDPLDSMDECNVAITPEQQIETHSPYNYITNSKNSKMIDSSKCICCMCCIYNCDYSNNNDVKNYHIKNNTEGKTNKMTNSSGYPNSLNKIPKINKDKATLTLNTKDNKFNSVFEYLYY